MTDTLFSDFLMVDLTTAPSKGRAATRVSSNDGRNDEPSSMAEAGGGALAAAIRQAVERAAPDEVATASSAELADALADVVSGNSVVLRLKSGLAEGQRDAVRTFLEALLRVSSTLEESRLEAAIGKLAEVILPDELADARGALASDNLALRDRFIAETPQLTSVEVAARAGHRTRNPYATAARWKKSGDVFSVHHRGTEYFPAFQFRDGRPHPTVKQALAVLPRHLSAWQRAFWFVSSNGWLDDRAPIDVLDDEDTVVAAARREGEEVVG